MIRTFVIASLIFLTASLTSRAIDFEVAEPFEVNSAIKPGLVAHPVMATLDDLGRLFIVENSGLNLQKDEQLTQRPNSIRLLVDTDRDGTFDRATTFADDLTLPLGALWIYDSLFVMSPPGLWRFADRDGDGIAEEREELVTGFDFEAGEKSVHGPFLHPNGRLFWTHGNQAFAIPDPDTGEILEEGKGARLWSSRLGGSDVEAFAKIGFRDPVEVDFTERGEMIGTANLPFRTNLPRSSLIHWIYGGIHAGEHLGFGAENRARTGDELPELTELFSIARGLTRYRSGHLDPAWKNGWLVAHREPPILTLTRFRREGSSFKIQEMIEILAANKDTSRLSDIVEDHSGDLLVIDSGFEGDPGTTDSKAVSGGIYRISRRGETYMAPDYPNWESLTSEAVSAFLDVEEPWLRDRAGLELAGRGDPAFPELRRILQTPSSSATAKRNAVWVLAKLRFSESTDLILEALKDSDPSVRQAACHAISVTRTWQSVAANEPDERIIELERNRTISGALASIVRSDEPPVARQAAVALGRMAEFRAVGAIIGRLGRVGPDRFLEHSLIYALIEIDDPESTKVGLETRNLTVKNGALRALHEMPSGSLEALDVIPYLDAGYDKIRRTAIEIATQSPHWDAALANRFYEWQQPNDRQIEALKEIVTAFPDHPPILNFLSFLLQSESRATQILGLELINEPDTITIPPDWEPTLADYLISNPESDLSKLTLRALTKTRQSHLPGILESLAVDTSLPVMVRLYAERALSPSSKSLSDPSFDRWLEVLKGEKENASREEAIRLVESLEFTPDQRILVFENIEVFSFEEAAHLLLTKLAPLQDQEEIESFMQWNLKRWTEMPGSGLFDEEEVKRILEQSPERVPEALSPPTPSLEKRSQ